MRFDDGHIAQESLELYAMSKMANQDIAFVEEHLYVCPDCATRLQDMEEYVRLMKAATARVADGALARKPGFSRFLSGRFWHVPKPVWVGAFAVLLLASVIPFRNISASVSEISLSALRDAKGSSTLASPGKVRLTIDQLPAESLNYRLEVVASDGKPIWSEQVAAANRLTALVPHTLRAGQYWVRLYTGAELSKEFSLRVK